jgi:hypothetical protein
MRKPRFGDSDLNARFGPLCGLKSDISRGPRSADIRSAAKRRPYSMTSSASC